LIDVGFTLAPIASRRLAPPRSLFAASSSPRAQSASVSFRAWAGLGVRGQRRKPTPLSDQMHIPLRWVPRTSCLRRRGGSRRPRAAAGRCAPLPKQRHGTNWRERGNQLMSRKPPGLREVFGGGPWEICRWHGISPLVSLRGVDRAAPLAQEDLSDRFKWRTGPARINSRRRHRVVALPSH